MRDLYPEDPKLATFNQRYTQDGFDPTAIRPLISPATQTRPKVAASIEAPASRQPSPPLIKVAQTPNSPKRPLPLDTFDNEGDRPRKMARGESPLTGTSGLAGAAGRRLDQLKRTRQPYESNSTGPSAPYMAPPPPLPREVMFLLSIIPPASTFPSERDLPLPPPEALVKLIQDITLPHPSQVPTRLPIGAPPFSQPAGQFNGELHRFLTIFETNTNIFQVQPTLITGREPAIVPSIYTSNGACVGLDWDVPGRSIMSTTWREGAVPDFDMYWLRAFLKSEWHWQFPSVSLYY